MYVILNSVWRRGGGGGRGRGGGGIYNVSQDVSYERTREWQYPGNYCLFHGISGGRERVSGVL